MLLCGCDPPTLETVCAIATRFPAGPYMLLGAFDMTTVLSGAVADAALFVTLKVWKCCGIVWALIVTEVEPAASPSEWPLLKLIGTRPRRFGSAKVVCPLPP